MVCQVNRVTLNLVTRATTDDLPERDAFKAWNNLKRKYKGKSLTEQLALQQEFYSSKLTDLSVDPDEWISSLDKLRKRLNKDFSEKISDKDLLIQVLNNMLEEYDATMELLMVELNADAENMLDECRVILTASYKKLKAKKDKQKEIDVEETVLTFITINCKKKHRKNTSHVKNRPPRS